MIDNIKKAVMLLSYAHKNQDIHALNQASNILDSYNHLKDFDELLKFYGYSYL